jgi:predicted transposase YbfD/YdcC
LEEAKSLMESFSIIPDPRLDRNKRHNLIDIIILAVCGVISGCDTWVDIEDYGETKFEWFNSFLELPNGIPSHDTFGRVFSLLDPLAFQQAFYEWVQGVVKIEDGEIISLDGKYMKASLTEAGRSRSMIGMVSAWASNAGVSLTQKRVTFEKSKTEKQVFGELIDFLKLNGHIVTMDANGCHGEITNKIIKKGGDFVVGLKSNQKSLLKSVKLEFKKHEGDLPTSETLDNSGHGRIEKRCCQVLKLSSEFLDLLDKKRKKRSQANWDNLNTVIKIISERTVNKKTTVTERFYISSLDAPPSKLLHVIRSHWNVENKLHWTLDVAFNEDRCRVIKGTAPENFAILRQLAINLIKQEKTSKRSVKGKRLKSAWDNTFLMKVISGTEPETFAV